MQEDTDRQSPAPVTKPPGEAPARAAQAHSPAASLEGVATTDSAEQPQQPTTADYIGGMNEAQMKWEHDIFRDTLGNVNQTLRFQIQLAVPILAACVTVLNIVPPQQHQEMLNLLDRWVFVPVLLSMGVGYRGLEGHWYQDKKTTKLSEDVQELYKMVRWKHKMMRWAILLQGLGLVLLMVFVLLEYK